MNVDLIGVARHQRWPRALARRGGYDLGDARKEAGADHAADQLEVRAVEVRPLGTLGTLGRVRVRVRVRVRARSTPMSTGLLVVGLDEPNVNEL
eukprot:CAMPEP_0119490044 /NCGR_PEP_ID=MMETSP1344-20130328/15327_1 /TAXON_ID=236787 /ORGANISM="Florenciella parvula, Strain CCMP2471" /LENGTH=93 /DNA_ID=CAMNT_0007525149 /DNA_START=33 /DNA_END=310 /DNA_ORIENTATION=+